MPTSVGDEPNDDVPTAERKSISSRHSFAGLDRGEEVAAFYQAKNAPPVIRGACPGKKGSAVWSMILGAIDAGFATRNTISFKTVSLRVLFTGGEWNYCNKFDLADRADRKKVAEYIMPAALAHRAEVIANPERLESIVADYWRLAQVFSHALPPAPHCLFEPPERY